MENRLKETFQKDKNLQILLDESSQTRLVKYLPSYLMDCFEAIPKVYLDMTQEDLEKIVNPSKRDICIRRAFWREYHMSVQTNTQMSMHGISRDICHTEIFKKEMKRSMFAAWVLKGFIGDEKRLEATYEKALEGIERIIEEGVLDANGHLDPVRVKNFLTTYKMLEDRVKGGIVQRSENKNLTVKVEQTIVDDRDKKLEDLKRRAGYLEILHGGSAKTN